MTYLTFYDKNLTKTFKDFESKNLDLDEANDIQYCSSIFSLVLVEQYKMAR